MTRLSKGSLFLFLTTACQHGVVTGFTASTSRRTRQQGPLSGLVSSTTTTTTAARGRPALSVCLEMSTGGPAVTKSLQRPTENDDYDDVMDNPGKGINKDDDEEDDLIEFTFEEQRTIENLQAAASEKGNTLRLVLQQALSSNVVPPKLIFKLRQVAAENSLSQTSFDMYTESIQSVATELNALLEERMLTAKQTLQQFLQAGEIRKLDSLIGKAAREGLLDAAYFQVLTMNLQAAMREDQEQMELQQQEDDNGQGKAAASRAQILRHIYTRCQEEVEKTIPAGTALLNKLLRTEQASIRTNLYNHYLTPQPASTVITTPDGQKVELKSKPSSSSSSSTSSDSSNNKSLVSLQEFVDAIAKAVEQIRTVENAGGMDRVTAAALVESCRQVAKEARMAVANSYGMDSTELDLFQNGLQPVFRPLTPQSPYIQGQ